MPRLDFHSSVVDSCRAAVDVRLEPVRLGGLRIGGLLGPPARRARVLERPSLPLLGTLGPSQGFAGQI